MSRRPTTARATRRAPTPALVTLLTAAALGACDGASELLTAPDGGVATDAGTLRPLRLLGVTPLRGPHTGGNRAVLEGAGFADDQLEVRVDGVPIPDVGVFLAGSARLVVTMPPHAPGAVDLAVRVRGAEAVLEDGYTYDALAVDPPLAPRTGGQRVTVRGQGTDFAAGDTFTFDGAACSELEIVSATEASCRVPSRAAAGVVDVAQVRDGATRATAPQGFEYVEDPLTFGGVTGGAIDGVLDVEVVGWVGPIEDAVVIVGDDPQTARQARTDADGHVRFEDPALVGPVTVHVGHHCYARTTLVGVDANALVIPLAAHRTGDPCPSPAVGGTGGGAPGEASGHLVFLEGQEFLSRSRLWTNVPVPRADERRVAYVVSSTMFFGGEDADPPRVDRVTPDTFDEEVLGFPFEVASTAGTVRICATAGIEPLDAEGLANGYRPFVVGCSPSVLVPPYGAVDDVIVEMTIRMTAAAEIDARPLPRLDVPTAVSPTELRDGLSANVAALFRLDPPIGAAWDESWIAGSPTTPSLIRFQRVPVRADWGSPDQARALVVWGDDGLRRGVSASRVIFPSLDAPLVATPLGVPEVTSPTPRGRIRPGEPVRFEVAGPVDVTLVRMVVAPADYVFGGAIPLWYLFARGDVREVVVPGFPDVPELAFPPSTYAFTVGIDERPGFDFDSWSFRTFELETAWERQSQNRVYARIDATENP